ncbi:MAG: glycosyltransferase family 1 protein, partial [Rhodoferax sp.]|nr:glycosyltransferase family 1 protein [Actinomycetota bacterium]
YVLGLDLSGLPSAYGTLSGWLVACHDLGTAVLGPRVGHWHEQQPALGFDLALDADGQAIVDEGSLRAAVLRAHATRPSWRADPAERRRQRARIAVAHRHLYRSVVSS